MVGAGKDIRRKMNGKASKEVTAYDATLSNCGMLHEIGAQQDTSLGRLQRRITPAVNSHPAVVNDV